MKNRIFILSIFLLLNLLLNTLMLASANALLPGVIESPYEACKEIIVVSKEKYQENPGKWKEIEAKCNKKVQLAEEAGITRLSSLNEGVQYLSLATKVAGKVISTLDKSRLYALCSVSCFSHGPKCSAETSGEEKVVNCSDRRAEVLRNLKVQTRKIRMELALSQEASDLITLDVRNVLSLDDDKRFNKNLRDFEAGTPNPVGRTEMQPAEIEHAKGIIKRERAKIEEDYKKMLVEKKAKDTPDLHHAWVSKMLMDQIDKRKEEHQLKYRQLIFEESPIFSVIEKPSKFQNGDVPVWSDQQIADAFRKLSKNAETTKTIVKESIDKGKLEFSRTKGEALGLWLKSLVPGTRDSNDLLYYMGMKNQVEEVLKEDSSMCGAATTMSNRLSSKEMQNMGVVFVGSFAGGALTKVASKAAVGVFRIGRALSGAEAAGLTGLAIGSTFLGDSFRQYNTAVEEVTSGVREASELDLKRSNVKWNLVFAPTLGPSGWGLGKTLYNSLGNKMAKDLPEVSKLMEKAGTSQAARDEVVDKWMLAKVKNAIKTKTIDVDEEALLKSEAGGKILDSLAAEIQKNNPKFFSDPNNFNFFLKTAATTLKKRTGDPTDLGEKAQYLFLSLNVDAFNTWDPKARVGLMKVFNEGVEELRSVSSKDPAAYAKFTTDPDSQEKIMIAALKRSGASDEDIAAMKTCALKK